MKRLRYVDVTMTLPSSGIVIRGLPGGGLPEKMGVLPYFSIGSFEQVGVRLKKLE